jgi:hypothetical protein
LLYALYFLFGYKLQQWVKWTTGWPALRVSDSKKKSADFAEAAASFLSAAYWGAEAHPPVKWGGKGRPQAICAFKPLTRNTAGLHRLQNFRERPAQSRPYPSLLPKVLLQLYFFLVKYIISPYICACSSIYFSYLQFAEFYARTCEMGLI